MWYLGDRLTWEHHVSLLLRVPDLSRRDTFMIIGAHNDKAVTETSKTNLSLDRENCLFQSNRDFE